MANSDLKKKSKQGLILQPFFHASATKICYRLHWCYYKVPQLSYYELPILLCMRNIKWQTLQKQNENVVLI